MFSSITVHLFNYTQCILASAIHCTDWASRGLNQSCIADIDPDGTSEQFGTVQVECDFDTEPGKAVTVIRMYYNNIATNELPTCVHMTEKNIIFEEIVVDLTYVLVNGDL